MISTVLGELPQEELGFCQPHEHVLVRWGTPGRLNPALCAQDVVCSGREVADYAQAGGRSLVDAQPIGCGRMPVELAHISRASGVHIVASTGFHVRRFYPKEHWLFCLAESELEELFYTELTLGMYQNADSVLAGPVTPHRAGIVKTAWEEEGLSPWKRRLFSAAARAALRCGAPVMVHVEFGPSPQELLEFLTGLGLPPHRLVFCHLDRAMPDGQTARRLCRAGAFLEYDTIGRFKYHNDETERSMIIQLLEEGYGGQLLLSLDITSRRMLAYGGEIGLSYLLKTFLPELGQDGVPQQAIRRMTVDNPAQLLAWSDGSDTSLNRKENSYE